jgi:hypothetical protein
VARRLALAVALVFFLLAPEPLVAERIDECGTVYPGYDCWVFMPSALPYRQYILPGWGSPLPWIVRIRGEVVACPGSCGPYGPDSCLTAYSWQDCPTEDLGCGVQSYFEPLMDVCCVWESFRYGRVILEASDCRASFVGDTVHVTGHISHTYENSICMMGPPYALIATLTLCPDTTTAARCETWGRLKARYR